MEKVNYMLELLKTLSDKTSFFSSKRIERFAVFSSMLSLSIWYLAKHIQTCSLSATDLILIVAAWLGYAGFNTVQINKDKKSTNE